MGENNPNDFMVQIPAVLFYACALKFLLYVTVLNNCRLCLTATHMSFYYSKGRSAPIKMFYQLDPVFLRGFFLFLLLKSMC